MNILCSNINPAEGFEVFKHKACALFKELELIKISIYQEVKPSCLNPIQTVVLLFHVHQVAANATFFLNVSS